MRGLGEFQLAQMKHRDRRVAEMCQHLRAAVDLYEQIASAPFRTPEAEAPVAKLTQQQQPITPRADLAADKLAYSIKEASVAVGIGKTKLYKLIRNGHLKTIRIGQRRLLRADMLKAWLASLASE